MSHYVFPSEFIFWSKNALHEKHKADLLPKIYANLEATENKQRGTWLCNVNTEYFDRANSSQKYIGLITEALYPALDLMFKEVQYLRHPTVSTIHEIWYNQYDTTGDTGQEVHTHPESNYSGVYFLELSEPNATVFYSQVTAVNKTASPSKETKFIKEGDILLFPSNLSHYVLPSKNQRTTIAFNINCSF